MSIKDKEVFEKYKPRNWEFKLTSINILRSLDKYITKPSGDAAPAEIKEDFLAVWLGIRTLYNSNEPSERTPDEAIMKEILPVRRKIEEAMCSPTTMPC